MEGDYKIYEQLVDVDNLNNTILSIIAFRKKNPHYVILLGRFLLELIDDNYYNEVIILDDNICIILSDILQEYDLTYLSFLGFESIVRLILCNVYKLELDNRLLDMCERSDIQQYLIRSFNSHNDTKFTCDDFVDKNNLHLQQLVINYCTARGFILAITCSYDMLRYYDSFN